MEYTSCIIMYSSSSSHVKYAGYEYIFLAAVDMFNNMSFEILLSYIFWDLFDIPIIFFLMGKYFSL